VLQLRDQYSNNVLNNFTRVTGEALGTSENFTFDFWYIGNGQYQMVFMSPEAGNYEIYMYLNETQIGGGVEVTIPPTPFYITVGNYSNTTITNSTTNNSTTNNSTNTTTTIMGPNITSTVTTEDKVFYDDKLRMTVCATNIGDLPGMTFACIKFSWLFLLLT
jgi:hypothetical protein